MNARRPGALFLAACALLAAACRAPRAAPPAFDSRAPDRLERPAAPPRFFAFGDFGTGGKGQARVAAGMAARAQATPPDFFVLLGDNFYPDGVASSDDSKWRTHFEEPYAAPCFARDFYVALGNHDHRGSVQAQLDYGASHARWQLPAPWYAFTVALPSGATADFFVLDTTQLVDETQVAAAQLSWLADALGKSSGRWQIVVGHHPVRSTQSRGLADYRERLEPVLAGFGVDLALFGHDHFSQWLPPSALRSVSSSSSSGSSSSAARGAGELDELHVAIAGGGGGADNADSITPNAAATWSATGGGFADVTLSEERIVIEFADADGKTQSRFEIAGGTP
ncbi:MAG: metallophosphoesterase [Planctomycetes bacterium]|nr:metallophosphoesterase [Planctomycetota bacterium]